MPSWDPYPKLESSSNYTPKPQKINPLSHIILFILFFASLIQLSEWGWAKIIHPNTTDSSSIDSKVYPLVVSKFLNLRKFNISTRIHEATFNSTISGKMDTVDQLMYMEERDEGEGDHVLTDTNGTFFCRIWDQALFENKFKKTMHTIGQTMHFEKPLGKVRYWGTGEWDSWFVIEKTKLTWSDCDAFLGQHYFEMENWKEPLYEINCSGVCFVKDPVPRARKK